MYSRFYARLPKEFSERLTSDIRFMRGSSYRVEFNSILDASSSLDTIIDIMEYYDILFCANCMFYFILILLL